MRFALTLWRRYLFMNFFWIKYNTIVIFCQFKNFYCLQNCKRAQITGKNIPLSYHVLYNAHKYADKKRLICRTETLLHFLLCFCYYIGCPESQSEHTCICYSGVALYDNPFQLLEILSIKHYTADVRMQ